MKTGIRTFSNCKKIFDGRLTIFVRFNSAHQIMTSWNHGNQFFHRVDAFIHTFLIDIRKVMQEFFSVHFPAVQAYIIVSADFQFIINGSCNNVPRSQFFALIVFLHKRFSVFGAKFCAIPTNGFGNQKQHSVSFRIHRRWVKLIILHIRNLALCSVNKGNSVTSRNNRVGCIFINVSSSSCSNQSNFRSNFFDFFILFIKNISAISIDISLV